MCERRSSSRPNPSHLQRGAHRHALDAHGARFSASQAVAVCPVKARQWRARQCLQVPPRRCAHMTFGAQGAVGGATRTLFTCQQPLLRWHSPAQCCVQRRTCAHAPALGRQTASGVRLCAMSGSYQGLKCSLPGPTHRQDTGIANRPQTAGFGSTGAIHSAA